MKFEIPSNSNLQTIEKYAFSCSNIEEIYFPASLRELKEGWCCDTNNLRKIQISPTNGQFKIEEDKYLIGKSDPNKDEFDKLLFACRNIKEISIPSNIKIFSSLSFQFCSNLTKVKIQPNSNLQTIKKYAFSWSNIKSIFIPSKVSIICEYAFCKCQNLTKVKIQPNSNLQTIESYAFSETNIRSIFIPSKVSIICKYAFSHCTNLMKVEIEQYAFYNAKIRSIFIPSKVFKIHEYAFCNCFDLQIVEISEESKLESFPWNFSSDYLNPECIFMIPTKK